MTKRKIPEDFKGEESDPKRSNAESSGVRRPEEYNSPDHIEDIEYEVLSEPEPVTPTVELIQYINGDAVYIPEQVDKWRSRYQEEENNKVAIVELLILLIEACCAKFPTKAELLDIHKIKEEFLHHYAIDKRLLADTHITMVMGALKNIAKIVNVEDYQSSEHFKDNFRLFWTHLVLKCQDGPLFDGIVFEKCMDYIIHLSRISETVYRQTATLMGFQLLESYIAIANSAHFKDITDRKFDSIEQKQTEEPHVESLNKTFTDTHKITLLEKMIMKIFQGLFVNRYRDDDQYIRTLCIEALGNMIVSYPSLFLKDLCLKYLGWTLTDKSADVRKASMHAMKHIYKDDHCVPTLGELTARISTRMIELADDIDMSVARAVCAIAFVKKLLRDHDVSLDNLYEFLIDDPASVRPALGKLVYDRLISQEFNSSQSSLKGDENNSSEVYLRIMLQILRKFSADRILIIYVIDDVWEHMAEMKDWKCINSMLLNENTSTKLDDEDATNLVWLLCASVKKTVGERIVPATDIRKPFYSQTDEEQLKQKKKDITCAMMKTYASLLTMFVDDKEKLVSLIEVIMYLDVQQYQEEEEFKNVLGLISKAFFKHKEKEALRVCIKAIVHCISNSQGKLKTCAQNVYFSLQETLVRERLLKSSVRDGDSLLENLKRLYELQSSSYVHTKLMVDTFEFLTSTLKSYRNDNEEVISSLLFNLHMSLQSMLPRLDGRSMKTTLKYLADIRVLLFKGLKDLLDKHVQWKGNDRNQASWLCIILNECWSLYKRINLTSKDLEAWRYSPDASMLQNFWQLCLQQLSISGEAEDEHATEYIEDTNKDAVMIAAVPWVVSDRISKAKEDLCPEISRFVNHGTSVAKIVKHMITFLKNDEELPKAFLKALKKAYQWHVIDRRRRDDESLSKNHFLEFEKLAAQLCRTFLDTSRNTHRSGILEVVNDGIEYAFLDAPKQLSFLQGAVLHFVRRLPTTDIQDIERNVQVRAENFNRDGDASGWYSYDMFLECLAKEGKE